MSHELNVHELNMDVNVGVCVTGGAFREWDMTRMDDWRTDQNGDDWGELNEIG